MGISKDLWEHILVALKYYADPKGWEGFALGYEWVDGAIPFSDKGNRAREIIEMIQEEECQQSSTN